MNITVKIKEYPTQTSNTSFTSNALPDWLDFSKTDNIKLAILFIAFIGIINCWRKDNLSRTHKILFDIKEPGTNSGIKEAVGVKGVSGVDKMSPKGQIEVKKSTAVLPNDAGNAIRMVWVIRKYFYRLANIWQCVASYHIISYHIIYHIIPYHII